MAMLDDSEDEAGSDLDPRVLEYFDRMQREGAYATDPQTLRAKSADRVAESNDAISRAQLGGIAEGLSKLGTLNGKSPDVKPLTTTLGGIDAAAKARQAGDMADEDDRQKQFGMNAKVYEYLQGRTDKANESEAQRAARGEQAQAALETKQQMSDDKLDMMKAIANSRANTTIQLNDAKNSARSDAADAKEAAGDVKRVTEFGNKMNPSLGRQGELGKTQARINAGERVKALALNPDGSVKNLTKKEMAELGQSVASLISNGGVASQHVIDSMTPQSLWGNVEEQISYLTNEPREAGMQKFVERLTNTALREIETAKHARSDAHQQIIASYPDVREKNPEAWARIVKKHGFDPDAFDEDFNYAPKAAPAAPAAPLPAAVGGGGMAVAAPAKAPPKDGDVKVAPNGKTYTRVGGQWIEHPGGTP